MKKTIAVFTLSFVVLFGLVFEVVNANFLVEELPKIYIKDDGSIEPKSAPIKRNGNTYALTRDIIEHALFIQCDNIIFDGKGYTLQGRDVVSDWAIQLTGSRKNITIKNFNITQFHVGIDASDLSNSIITKNTINCNSPISIGLGGYGNQISYNTLIAKYENMGSGIFVGGSFNVVVGNSISSFNRGIVFMGDHNEASNNIVTNATIPIDTTHAPDTILENNILPAATPSQTSISATTPSDTSSPTEGLDFSSNRNLAIIGLIVIIIVISIPLIAVYRKKTKN